MDVQLAATHEAGHAVMQWFVGLELGPMVMTVEGTNASKPSTCCPRLPLPTLSDLRRRLLVLLAGNAVTLERWPDSWNNRGDWDDMCSALKDHFKLASITWVINGGKTPMERFLKSREPVKRRIEDQKTDNPEANLAMQDAIAHCCEIVAHQKFQEAVGKVAAAFIAAPPGEDGMIRLEGPAAVAICQAVIGEDCRAKNPWSAWLAGENQ